MGVKLGNGKWAIKEDKLLAYNDNSGRFFNKEFDFSRGSSATYVAKDGLIKTAGLQATNLVNNGDFSELGAEIITNGNFDTDSNWTKGTGWSIENGVATLDGTQVGSSSLSSTPTPVISGKTYKIVINVLSESSGFRLYDSYGVIAYGLSVGENVFYRTVTSSTYQIIPLGLSGTTGSIDNISVKQVDPNDYWTLGTGWSIGDGVASCDGSQTGFVTINQSNVVASGKLYKIKFTLTRSAGSIRPEVGSSGLGTFVSQSGTFTQYITQAGNNTLYFKSDSNFVGSITNISVQEIQTDTPRIDFSDSVKGALLLEPQSTNKITNYIPNSNWVIDNGAIVTENYAISPDGTQNASRIQLDNSGSNTLTRIYSNFVPDSTNDTASFYAKSNTENSFNITFYLRNTGFGTVRGQKQITVTNEWQRFDLTADCSGASFVDLLIYNTTSNENWDFLMYGIQVEALSYNTSVIPTFGSSATRLADVCNNSGSAQDFNSEEGVIYAEIAALADDGTFRLISLDGGDNTNVVKFGYRTTSNAIYYEVRSGNISQAFQVYTTTDVKQFHKVAVLYQQNNFKLFINGVNVLSDTSGITPVGLNNISFDVNSAAPFYGKVRELQVFTEALTDEQIEKLTTI